MNLFISPIIYGTANVDILTLENYELTDKIPILDKCIEVKKLLITSINTAKSKLNK